VTVHLVGAGPGDPDLLTLRAARLLGRADAVVHDRLVGAGVLELVPPWAERHDVGKCPGERGPSQAEIDALLVSLGRRLDCVVRLKGGDPFVFGRGAEEAVACAAAGVEVSVVPGVSSAVAGPAAGGLAVTRRGMASGVCIVTAHQDPDSAPVDWQALARSGLTLVVLMGAGRARAVRDRLLAGGMSPSTPVAVVTDATTPDQRMWQGRLSELGVAAVPSPSVIVVGETAAHPLDLVAPHRARRPGETSLSAEPGLAATHSALRRDGPVPAGR
jgi:uroporphyrin-III C-methyltransferase